VLKHSAGLRLAEYPNQYSGGKRSQSDKLSFSQSAAICTGRSSRTVHRLVRIANNLTPETRRLLIGTDWADNQRTLLRLCKMPPEMQESVARKLASKGSKGITRACKAPLKVEIYKAQCDISRYGALPQLFQVQKRS
jgi:hypothetical protein